MIKYYTRACNFYFGSISLEKVKKKKSLPLHGNRLISFDTVEIFTRKNIKLAETLDGKISITNCRYTGNEKWNINKEFYL